ncbi:MAG: 50S ribosomal protein L6 [Candidatus Nanohaloarchaea archaeon]
MEIKTEIPDGIDAEYDGEVLEVTDGDQEVSKKLNHALVNVEVDGDEIVFTTETDRKNVTSIAKSFRSHAENMIEGLEEEYVYRMKGVYAHFPMNIKKEDGEVVIENFMGERNPRRVEIMEGVDVEVDGEDLTITGPDKENVSQTAARIEQMSSKGSRDPRSFQDGVYILEEESDE